MSDREQMRDALLAKATVEQAQLLNRREGFMLAFCALKGWDIDNLLIPHIIELRKHPAWPKDPDAEINVNLNLG